MPVDVRTASEQVYEELRGRIVRNDLRPGAALPLAEIATTLGVSTMPVRSALSALEAEGLVRRHRHRGVVVAPVEVQDLEVIQAVRAGIEGLAARTGAARLTDSDLASMRRLLMRCREIAPRGALDLYLESQWALQDVCYAASGRPRLIELILGYRRRAERYIRLTVGGQSLSNNLPFHEQFFEACLHRDGQSAERVLCEALEWTVETLLDVVRSLETSEPQPPR